MMIGLCCVGDPLQTTIRVPNAWYLPLNKPLASSAFMLFIALSPRPIKDHVGIFCFAQSPTDKLAAPAPTVQATHSTESMPPAGQPVSELLRYLLHVPLSIFHWHDLSRSLTPKLIAKPNTAEGYVPSLWAHSRDCCCRQARFVE